MMVGEKRGKEGRFLREELERKENEEKWKWRKKLIEGEKERLTKEKTE